jgi:phage tail-like protein
LSSSTLDLLGAENPFKTRNPLMGYRFLVEIMGIISAGFNEVSGLEIETQVEEIRQGGINDHSYKLPKGSTHSNLVFKRGMSFPSSETLWIWYRSVVAGVFVRMPIFIYILDEDGSINPSAVWCAWAAYPVKWVGPSLTANSGQVAIEQLEFAHHGLERV